MVAIRWAWVTWPRRMLLAGRTLTGRRVPFSLALVGLILGITVLTGGVMGTLAWREKRALSRELVEAAMARTARLAAAHTEAFLRDAESAVRLGRELVVQGLLDPDHDQALERFTLAMLRAHPQAAWVSYGDRDDRFVGAWRDAQGRIYLNRSWPTGGRIRMEEDRLWPDGRREPVRRSDDHRYRPRERPYFRLAERQRAVAWTEPYEFYAGGGMGVSCVVPIMDDRGAVRGVFTADLLLDSLAEFLDSLRVSPRGQVVVSTPDGRLVAAPRRTAAAGDPPLLRLQPPAGGWPDVERAFDVEREGGLVLVRSVPLSVAATPWRVLVSVPEQDYAEPVEAVARRAAVLGVAGLALVAVAGVMGARRLSRPLRRLAARAGTIRRRDAAGQGAAPHDEIEALTLSVDQASRAARDRARARRLLGRYVSPELADRWLLERRSVRVAGEARDVTVLMSDLRGFSELSERLGPEAVFELLNRYLERMIAVIAHHGGSINAFVGDGILVLFGAPTRHPDDAARAVRCAWAMQEGLGDFNREGQAHGLPELGMGIGIHAGLVMAGSIGGRDRAAYTVVGPVVNRTSRMVDLAGSGEVLLSDTVLALAGHVARVGPSRVAQVKGVAGPITIYPLLGVIPDGPGAPGTGPTDRPGSPEPTLTA